MAKTKKIPKAATGRQDKKTPRIPSQYTDKYPAWRFSCVDKSGPFAWPTDKDLVHKLVKSLHNFDGMTWPEIEGHRHHSINVSSLSSEAKFRLEEIKLDDVDEVFSFALGGEPRMICIRDRHIAKLLWYDPKHKVCPSAKKHT